MAKVENEDQLHPEAWAVTTEEGLCLQEGRAVMAILVDHLSLCHKDSMKNPNHQEKEGSADHLNCRRRCSGDPTRDLNHLAEEEEEGSKSRHNRRRLEEAYLWTETPDREGQTEAADHHLPEDWTMISVQQLCRDAEKTKAVWEIPRRE